MRCLNNVTLLAWPLSGNRCVAQHLGTSCLTDLLEVGPDKGLQVNLNVHCGILLDDLGLCLPYVLQGSGTPVERLPFDDTLKVHEVLKCPKEVLVSLPIGSKVQS
jgi:hypothetical protein